jgi:hypothetical protein
MKVGWPRLGAMFAALVVLNLELALLWAGPDPALTRP